MKTAVVFYILASASVHSLLAQPGEPASTSAPSMPTAGVSADASVSQPSNWNSRLAAQYLDSREAWWLKWSVAQRDHGTACVSCHTALPYALSRQALRSSLQEKTPSQPEQQMLDYVSKRVSLWSEVEPFYNDTQAGANKTVESRGTESVLNALVLANHDSEMGTLTPQTKTALNVLWAQQLKNGPAAGAWEWLQFHNAPWEGNESRYLGATMASIAVGLAPGNYRELPEIQANLAALTEFLRNNYQQQPLLNRAMLLVAAARLPQLLTKPERAALEDEIFSKQRGDGGWNLASLGSWEERHDHTPFNADSDGYATGVMVLALEQAGIARDQAAVQKGLQWLQRNQDPVEGRWRSWSLNKNRDLNSDIGKFMSDAATAYAVMALEDRL